MNASTINLSSTLSKLQHKLHPWLITEEWNFQLSYPKGQIYPWCKPELSSEINLALGDFFPPTHYTVPSIADELSPLCSVCNHN